MKYLFEISRWFVPELALIYLERLKDENIPQKVATKNKIV
jgi:hypothetical protein